MGLGRVWPDVGPSYCLCRRGDGRYSRIQVVVVDAVRTVMNGSVRDDDSLLRRSAGERMEQVQECLVVLAPRDTFTLSSRAEPVPQTVRNDCLLDACTVLYYCSPRAGLPNLQPCPLSFLVHGFITSHHLSLHFNSPRQCISSRSLHASALVYGLCTFNLCLYATAVPLCLVSILRLSPQCPTDFDIVICSALLQYIIFTIVCCSGSTVLSQDCYTSS